MLQLLQVTLILPLLFLKVIGENEATRLLRKVRKLSGKHFGDSFEYVKYSDMIKRTNNEQLFFTVEMIGLALKMRRKISFIIEEMECYVRMQRQYRHFIYFSPSLPF